MLVGIPDGSLCTIGGWVRESLVYTVIARPNGVSVAAIFGEYAVTKGIRALSSRALLRGGA